MLEQERQRYGKRDRIDKLLRGEIPVDFDWNTERYPSISVRRRIQAEPSPDKAGKIKFLCEGLRDGLQGVRETPSREEMLAFTEQNHRLGIDHMTVGIYNGDNSPLDRLTQQFLGDMRDQYPGITPVVLSLATDKSLNWAARCKEINPKLETIVFMGTAPSRMYAEGWTKDFVLQKLDKAVGTAVKNGLPVIGATEHTTQTPPDFLDDIIKVMVNNGAFAFCIADTIGKARPVGAHRIVRHVKKYLDELSAPHVLVDWHGHRDMGNDAANAMAAAAAGADRIHTVPWGVGERAGNTSLEPVIINLSQILKEANRPIPWNLSALSGVLDTYRTVIHDRRQQDHGPLGRNAGITGAGIHANAINNLQNDAELVKEMAYNTTDMERREQLLTVAEKLRTMGDNVYVGINLKDYGREVEIVVSPYSGISNVEAAARRLGISPKTLSQTQKEYILQTAKGFGRVLTDGELKNLLQHQYIHEIPEEK